MAPPRRFSIANNVVELFETMGLSEMLALEHALPAVRRCQASRTPSHDAPRVRSALDPGVSGRYRSPTDPDLLEEELMPYVVVSGQPGVPSTVRCYHENAVHS